MHKRRLNHLLCFVLIALLLQGSSRGEVIPIVRESQGGEDLRRLNTLLSLLRPDEVFFFSAYPLSKAGLEGAPDLNVVLEAAFVTAGNRVRFVPAEALPAVLQIHSNTPIYAVRGGITAFDRAITNRLTGITLQLLLEWGRKFLQVDGDLQWEKEATRISVALNVQGPDGVLLPRSGAQVEALLLKERRGRKAAALFYGSGGGAVYNLVVTPGNHEALQAVLERCVFLCVAKKVAAVPYWKASIVDKVDTDVTEALRDEFNRLDRTARIGRTQLLLKFNGYASMPISGVMDGLTVAALKSFCIRRNLRMEVEPTPDLYVELNTAADFPLGSIAEETQLIDIELRGKRATSLRPILANLWSVNGLQEVTALGKPGKFSVRLSGQQPWEIEHAIRAGVPKIDRDATFIWSGDQNRRKLIVIAD